MLISNGLTTFCHCPDSRVHCQRQDPWGTPRGSWRWSDTEFADHSRGQSWWVIHPLLRL